MELEVKGSAIKKRRPLTDLVGTKVGRLDVLKALRYEGKSGRLVVLCRCECGTEKEILAQSLRSGLTFSCGCLNRDREFRKAVNARRTHGMTGTATYRVWRNMHTRCENPKVNGYEHYGERGISVCERWFKFENFLEDMGEKPDGLSIDRIDVNGNYEPGNCRWATNAQQAVNRRDNRVIEYNGISQCLSEWANMIGVKPSTLHARLKAGVPIEIALTRDTLPRDYLEPLRYKNRSEIKRKPAGINQPKE